MSKKTLLLGGLPLQMWKGRVVFVNMQGRNQRLQVGTLLDFSHRRATVRMHCGDVWMDFGQLRPCWRLNLDLKQLHDKQPRTFVAKPDQLVAAATTCDTKVNGDVTPQPMLEEPAVEVADSVAVTEERIEMANSAALPGKPANITNNDMSAPVPTQLRVATAADAAPPPPPAAAAKRSRSSRPIKQPHNAPLTSPEKRKIAAIMQLHEDAILNGEITDKQLTAIIQRSFHREITFHQVYPMRTKLFPSKEIAAREAQLAKAAQPKPVKPVKPAKSPKAAPKGKPSQGDQKRSRNQVRVSPEVMRAVRAFPALVDVLVDTLGPLDASTKQRLTGVKNMLVDDGS